MIHAEKNSFMYDAFMKKYKQYASCAIVSFWMIIALSLRLFHLTHESLWWDEYASHVFLDAPSLLSFLAFNRTLDPLSLPVYYVLEYGFFHYISESVVALRCMSIAIALATFPVVYSIGKKLHQRRAGLIAVALLALSPVHIHHSQGIRMYVAFIFLASLMIWSFLLLLERPQVRFWILHGFISLLLYWTHPFAGLLTLAIGAFLLTNWKYRLRFILLWCLCQGFLLVPILGYLSTLEFWSVESTSQWIASPTLTSLGAQLFFQDISAFDWQFRLSWIAQRLAFIRYGTDFVFAACIVTLLFTAAFNLYKNRKYAPAKGTLKQTELLFSWLLLPPVILFLMSVLLRPCMFPRYTAHCILPLYLLLGIALSPWRRSKLFFFLGGFLLVSMLLQWLWLQPGPQRTDWRSAGKFLHEQVGNNDIVLVENSRWRDVFQHNLRYLAGGSLGVPVVAAENTPLLAAQSVLCCGLSKGNHPGDVWAVIAMHFFDPGPPIRYEQQLKDWGISFERWFFPSTREIYVYKLKIPDKMELPASLLLLRDLWQNNKQYDLFDGAATKSHALEAFSDLILALSENNRALEAKQLLEDLFQINGYWQQMFTPLYDSLIDMQGIEKQVAALRQLWQGYGYRDAGHMKFADQDLEESLRLEPENTVVWLELFNIRIAMKNYSEGADALEQVIERDPKYFYFRHLIDVIHRQGKVEKALAAVKLYEEGIFKQSTGLYGQAISHLEKAIQTDPQFGEAYTALAFILLSVHNPLQAEKVLERYFSSIHPSAPGAYGLMALIYALYGDGEQATEYMNEAFEISQDYKALFEAFFISFFKEQNKQATLREMDILKAKGIDLYPILADELDSIFSEIAGN